MANKSPTGFHMHVRDRQPGLKIWDVMVGRTALFPEENDNLQEEVAQSWGRGRWWPEGGESSGRGCCESLKYFPWAGPRGSHRGLNHLFQASEGLLFAFCGLCSLLRLSASVRAWTYLKVVFICGYSSVCEELTRLSRHLHQIQARGPLMHTGLEFAREAIPTPMHAGRF